MSSSSSLPAFDRSHRPQYTESPHPGWSIGQRIESSEDGKEWAEGEKAGWKVMDLTKEQPVSEIYHLMISGIVPRPIAFVSSMSPDGMANIAPFSFFNMVCSNPPIVAFTSNGPHKDTSRNIIATKEFTVNLISVPWTEQANVCSTDMPADQSEWPFSGLTKAPSVHVKPARVQESAFSMECELYQTVEIIHPVTKVHTSTHVLGLVKHIHVRNDVLNERGVVDATKYKPLSRLGDTSYGTLGDAFRLPRPAWKVDGEKMSETLKSLVQEDERLPDASL